MDSNGVRSTAELFVEIQKEYTSKKMENAEAICPELLAGEGQTPG
jgi:hypothetical protein